MERKGRRTYASGKSLTRVDSTFSVSRDHLNYEQANGTAANLSWDLRVWSRIRLEPIPKKNEITGLFRSFDRITRMKLTLRIPNPELNRYTAAIYEDMKIGGIREMTQDMRNPSGLSLSQDARPYASAVLAEQGYKKGEVQLEGVRNGEWEEARSGSVAARGGVSGLRDFIRGLSAIAKAKETQRALEAVAAEVDRVHPREPEHG